MTYALLAGLCFYISRQFAEAAGATQFSNRDRSLRIFAARLALINASILMVAAILLPS